MTTLEAFNQIEAKLIEIAKSIPEVREVTAAETYKFRSPRVYVWIREGESRDATISGTKRSFRIRFEYVIDVVHPNPEQAYNLAKQIAWSLHDALMQNRTLDGLVRDVQPSAYFFKEDIPTDQGFGQRWIMYVDVEVEV